MKVATLQKILAPALAELIFNLTQKITEAPHAVPTLGCIFLENSKLKKGHNYVKNDLSKQLAGVSSKYLQL